MEGQIERLLARQGALQEERERLARVLAAEARAPRRNWQGAFEWDTRVAQLLGTVFGLPSFRPLQREVINATLQVGAGCCCACTLACAVDRACSKHTVERAGSGRLPSPCRRFCKLNVLVCLGQPVFQELHRIAQPPSCLLPRRGVTCCA